MKSMIPRLALAFFLSGTILTAVPDKIELQDGRTLDGVTAAKLENGKVKVTHSTGVARIPVHDVKPQSLARIGIKPEDFPQPDVPVKRKITTTDGTIYTGVRHITVKPSFITFSHLSGISTVRFDKLDDQTRKEFGYDPALAKKFDLAQVASAEAAKSAEKEIAAKRKQDRADAAIIEAQNERAEALKLADSDKKKIEDRKVSAVRIILRTGYGTKDYWLCSGKVRSLLDASVADFLMKSGLTPKEIRDVMDSALDRWPGHRFPSGLGFPWSQ